MKKIGKAIRETISKVKEKIKSFFNNIREKIKSMSNKIKSKFKNKTEKNVVIDKENNSIKTNNIVQSRDNNIYKPNENMYIYKQVDNNLQNNVNKSKTDNQQIITSAEINDSNINIKDNTSDSNEEDLQQNINIEKIQEINIKEETGEVQYTTIEGKTYIANINEILDNKKKIYKNFGISKKCKQLTGSFIKRKKLEKSLNPVVINGLNNDEEIDKYINCVNNEEKLFFDLKHDTQNSKLNFFDKYKMRKVAEIEKKLGADVQMDLSVFETVKMNIKSMFEKKENETKKDEKMIKELYKNSIKRLKNKAVSMMYESKEYSTIEDNLEKCANWYMENGNFKKSDICIKTLAKMLREKNKNYYRVKYEEEKSKGNMEYAIEHYEQEYLIKNCNLEKLKIKNEFLKENTTEAENLYKNLLSRLGIILTQEEHKKSIENGGLLNGTYTHLEIEQKHTQDGTTTFNNIFKNISIIGNEKLLEDLKVYRNIKNSVQPNMKIEEENEEEKSINVDEEGKENNNQNKEIEREENEGSKTSAKKQLTRKDIGKISNYYKKLDEETKYGKGSIATYIVSLINYLEKNDDKQVQEILDKALNNLCQYKEVYYQEPYKIHISILHALSNLYKDGIKSDDGERIIVDKDLNKHAYFLFLANYNKRWLENKCKDIKNLIDENNKKIYEAKTEEEKKPYEASIKRHQVNLEKLEEKINKSKAIIEGIEEEYLQNKEEIDYKFLQYLKEKNNIENAIGKDALIAEANFFEELSKIRISKNNSDYMNLAIAKENLSRVNSKENLLKFNQIKQSVEEKIKKKEEVHYRTLELLGDIYYNGITRKGFNEVFVNPDKISAEKVYSKLIEEYRDNANSQTYNRLLELYTDKKLPIYDLNKAKKTEEMMKQNGIEKKEEKQETSIDFDKGYTYVCSDLHGDNAIYQSIISKLKSNDKLYILGDTVDKGIKVLQDIMKKEEEGQIKFLIGNHEWALLYYDIFKELDKNPNLKYEEYKKNTKNIINRIEVFEEIKELSVEERNKTKDFLLNSPAYKQIKVNGEDIFLVHAKADESANKEIETVREMIESDRKEELWEMLQTRADKHIIKSTGKVCREEDVQKKGVFTIVGHTPQEKGVRYNNCGALYIDNFYKKPVIRLEDGKVMYFDSMVEREKMEQKENNQKQL